MNAPARTFARVTVHGMSRALVALMCLVAGCTSTTWRMTSGGDPAGRPAFLVTADRAVVVEDAEGAAGRVGGHVIRMWQLPAGTQTLPLAQTPSEVARLAGWTELPATGFFSTDAANVRAIQVTEITPGSKIAIVLVCALGGLAVLAVAPLIGAANAN